MSLYLTSFKNHLRTFLVAGLLATGGITKLAAANSGVTAIGFSAWSKSDRATLVDCYAQAGGRLELASLYYSFDRSDPTLELDEFVRALLPKLSGTLNLKLYLDSGPNRRSDPYGAAFLPNLRPNAFWRLAGGRSSDPAVSKFYADWKHFINPAVVWSGKITRWADSQGYAGKLHLEIVPVLEDDAGEASRAYRALTAATQQAFRAALPATAKPKYTRSPNGGNTARRIEGLGLEFHSTSKNGLHSGDAITADGVMPGGNPLTIAQWRPYQRDALRHKITALYWHPGFNGGPRDVRPDQRGELTPFKVISKTSLTQLLKVR